LRAEEFFARDKNSRACSAEKCDIGGHSDPPEFLHAANIFRQANGYSQKVETRRTLRDRNRN
jgi:hypothetical protein